MKNLPVDIKKRVDLAKVLVFRLERLSADSYWAHRASGMRGSLLKYFGTIETDPSERSSDQLDRLIEHGLEILEKAAREL